MNKILKIAIGCDHAGFLLKEELKSYIEKRGNSVKDFGCYSEERADYPDAAHAVAKSVTSKESEIGILICGSGNGINMTANKHQEIRSALCWNKEIAELARLHNDANIIALPARFITIKEAIEMVDVFLQTNFEGGRHSQRVNKISC
jgi:ribose 5-phosphate isomerase B